MKLIIKIILLSFLNLGYSQNNEMYLFSKEINKKSQENIENPNYQSYSIEFMNIGDYKGSLFMEEQTILKNKNLKFKKDTLRSSFSSFLPVNAVDEIIKKSSTHQIIIINEAHNSALNRIFTASLLEGLHKNGFKTLFLEGLQYGDKDLNDRKYPSFNSGFLIKEPQYGNLIRQAFELGYTTLPYEHGEDRNLKDPMKRWYSREEGQADNILKYLKNNPEAKIIIHCGYGHLGEEIYDGEIKGSMAAIIKLKSGINPLTINQVAWLEKLTKDTHSPYRDLLDKQDLSEASIFVNDKGDLFSSNPKKWDVNVYFPPTKYIGGRPDWLMFKNKRKSIPVPFNKIDLEPPFLIMAYRKDEDKNISVPVDIIEIKNTSDKKELALRSGNYDLLILDSLKKSQIIKINVD